MNAVHILLIESVVINAVRMSDYVLHTIAILFGNFNSL